MISVHKKGPILILILFQSGGQSEVAPGHVKLVKRGNKMEVLLWDTCRVAAVIQCHVIITHVSDTWL